MFWLFLPYGQMEKGGREGKQQTVGYLGEEEEGGRRREENRKAFLKKESVPRTLVMYITLSSPSSGPYPLVFSYQS